MYSPAFPQVTADLRTSASAVGLTLTAFFIGMALGQLVGGAVSDQRGRRGPMILGGLVCTLGALVCAFAPSIGVLMLGRVLQGFGGGAASAPTSATCSRAPSPASRCSPTSPPRPSSSRGSRA
ncbi:MFS transporter [Actinomyces haliotis]|uniref:MFS transporter n=1 Tax=Actinomyces haliotis TaxID=1280843 RepID=UPI001E498A84|nr:MFS transporter [Actinomyces haliotis]